MQAKNTKGTITITVDWEEVDELSLATSLVFTPTGKTAPSILGAIMGALYERLEEALREIGGVENEIEH